MLQLCQELQLVFIDDLLLSFCLFVFAEVFTSLELLFLRLLLQLLLHLVYLYLAQIAGLGHLPDLLLAFFYTITLLQDLFLDCSSLSRLELYKGLLLGNQGPLLITLLLQLDDLAGHFFIFTNFLRVNEANIILHSSDFGFALL